MAQVRSISEDTAELSEEEVGHQIFVMETANMGIADIPTRHDNTARKIIRSIKQLKEDACYFMNLTLVANNVDPDILEELPTQIGNYHVKSVVINNNLYITSVVTGDPHSGGVASLTYQAGAWNRANGNCFDVGSDANTRFGANFSGAPDLKLVVRSIYRAANAAKLDAVIVELEVNNRSPRDLRAVYARYFEDSSVLSVVVIKFYKTANSPVESACAIQWSRGLGGNIVVTAVRDFGIMAIHPTVKNSFFVHQVAEIDEPDPLPPVALALWNAPGCRSLPVDVATLQGFGNGEGTDINAMKWIVAQANSAALYPNAVPPTITFPRADLTTVLHNIPNNAMQNDFVLDLCDVLYCVARAAV